MKKLEGKTIIVVGATGDIGSIFCKRAVAAGANVVLASRTESDLSRLAKELGPQAWPRVTHADDLTDVEYLFKESMEKFGRIDGVLISVGKWEQLGLTDEYEKAENMIQSHFRMLFLPVFNVGFVAQKFFREQTGGGLIVNISSHAAVRPHLKGNLTYGPMKAAGTHFMRSLLAELAATEVRSTDLMPTLVDTPKNRESLSDLTEKDWANAVKPEEIANWIIDNFDNQDIDPEKLFEGKTRV